MADKRITQLPASTGLVSTDLVPVVDDPNGTPETQRATVAQVAAAVQAIFDAVPTYDPAGSASTAQTQAEAASVSAFDYDAKGLILVGGSSTPGDIVALAVGANNTFIVADSSVSGGLKYVRIENDQSLLASQVFG